MSILSIIIIILLVFGIAVFFRLIKNVFKAAIYVFVLLAILLFVFGIWIYTDAADFRKNIAEKPLTFLLVEKDNLIAGVKVMDFASADILLLTNKTIDQYDEYISAGNFYEVLGDSYKVFFFNISVLEKMTADNLSYRGFNLTNEEALNILRNDYPIDYATGLFAEKNGFTMDEQKAVLRSKLVEEFKTDQKFKDAVFALFVAKLFPSQNLYIAKNMKTKEIIVYPESAMFKAIKYIPESWIMRNMERGGKNQSEVLEEKG